MPEDWWVTQPGQVPVGPVSADLVVRGIEAGKIPDDSLVCEVGGASWRAIAEVTAFSEALQKRGTPRKFDPKSEQTLFDPLCEPATERPPKLDGFKQFDDDTTEHTLTDMHTLRRSDPPRFDLTKSDGTEDRTVVEENPLRPSEFPPKG